MSDPAQQQILIAATPSNTDRIVTVSGLTLGAQSINGILPAGFNNPACTVFQNTSWTPLSTKYLRANSAAQYVVESTPDGSHRDVELTTWTRVGYVFVRLSSGMAIYFYHSGDTSTGTLEIGIVTGLSEASYPGGTLYPLYVNTNLVGTVTGYNRTNTTGAFFTFGVNGFDVYAKFNGTEFCRFKEYRHMAAGTVALKALTDTNYGFRDITLHSAVDTPLYSDYASNQIDMRDWGMRSVQTTGTISASSTSLVVASATNIQVGDFLIVEIGAEAGAGLRGTIGVGGVYPALHYANAAAMNADTGQANNTLAWTDDTGNTYQWLSGSSTWLANASWDTIGNGWGGYYTAKAIPMSLQARVTAIVGTTITLDTAATVTATNATVYLDNQLYANDLLQDTRDTLVAITTAALTLKIPAGSYCLGGTLRAGGHDGWTIQGAGQGSTTLFSGKGLRGAGIFLNQCNSSTVKDLTISGNAGLNYYGFKFPTTLIPIPTSTAATQYDAAGLIRVVNNAGDTVNTQTSIAEYYGSNGINLITTIGSVVQDVTCNNFFTNAVQLRGSNSFGYRITVNVNYEQQTYTQWQLEVSNSTNCGFTDVTINSVKLCPGLESFVATGTQFIRPTLNNCALSLNNVGGFLIDGLTITVQANSQSVMFTDTQGMVQISTNTGSDLVGPGGTLRNPNTTIQGYVNASNDIPYGILIGPSNPNITISGGSYTGPDYAAPSALIGPHAIHSDGINTLISCFTANGHVAAGATTQLRSNIGIADGSVAYCRAWLVYQPGGVTLTGNVLPTDPLPGVCPI